MTTHHTASRSADKYWVGGMAVLAIACLAYLLGGAGVLRWPVPNGTVSEELGDVPVHILPTAGVLGLGLLACACALAGAVIILRRRR
jgi:hypothetical protein